MPPFNPLAEVYAPRFVDVLVAEQGRELAAVLSLSISRGDTSVAFDRPILDANVALLAAHGFRISSFPQAISVAGIPIRCTIAWS